MENPISITQATIHQGSIAVLQNVNLQVSEGEFVYLIGRTGSGKSSLLKTLYGELKLQEGRIDIAGYDLQSIMPKDIPFLRRKLGIVFQDFQLLTDRNVLDNLMFVLSATGWKNKHEMLDRCKAVLEKVGLQTKDYKIPAELSGGEQQRLVIARALLNDPKVLLADEPTGNLDPEVSDEIMMLLKNIAREGTSILMATHDYRLIQKFGGTVCKLDDRTLKQVDSFQIS
ncbi:MAG: ATP-binding cassette domain-containing protein [Bacteroidetes bacterium]|nr:ATP-binding cassette domain-containing protein [Bacteroidota bacterium]MDA1224063.1 ATP-binding cassette domain-containing protein [Bacteroidota bacterium]